LKIDRRMFHRLDYVLLLAIGLIVAFGLVVLNSAAANETENYLMKQCVWLAVGVTILLISLSFDYSFFAKYYGQIYGFALFLLVAVLIFGKEIKGAKSWFVFPGIGSLQPAEIAKILIIVSFAQFLVNRRGNLNKLTDLIACFAFFVPPVLLILLQPDMGSAMVYLAIMIGMMFAAGANWKWMTAIFGGGLCAGIGYIVGIWKLGWWSPLKPHQLNRFLVLFDSSIDRQGVGWNAWQAKIAIGNGGLTGQGLGAGSQSAGEFLPEQWTDFIFAVLCEETGFVGAFFLLVLFAVVFYRGLRIGFMSKDVFGYLIAVGIITMYFFHVFENIGMNMGIMPIAGIPLPFVSYGGSSTLTNFLGLAFLQNIYLRRQRLSF